MSASAKHVGRVRKFRAPVAADGREATLDNLQVEPVAKRLHYRPGAVGTLRVGHQDTGVSHRGVVLANKGLEHGADVFCLILGRNDNGQF